MATYRTRICHNQTPVAEWLSLAPRPRADREQIAADLAMAMAGIVPTLCVCCDAPATHVLGDWDLCSEHYNALSAPFPEELDPLWP